MSEAILEPRNKANISILVVCDISLLADLDEASMIQRNTVLNGARLQSCAARYFFCILSRGTVGALPGCGLGLHVVQSGGWQSVFALLLTLNLC